jgi:magnesium transporter
MKRKKRKTVHLIPPVLNKEQLLFEKGDCSLMYYQDDHYTYKTIEHTDELFFHENTGHISWVNIYGFKYSQAIKQIIQQNKIDEFVINLTAEQNHRNKVIELSNCFFFTLKAPVYAKDIESIEFEQLLFIVGKDNGYVWTIQEVPGDHFGHIRTRIKENVGIVRKRKTDYLFYLLIEAVIDTYYGTYELLVTGNERLKAFGKVSATPEFAELVEKNKANLFQIKKASYTLKDALSRLEKIEFEGFNVKYLAELKEQISLMNDDIDFNLHQLESSINLIINIQNNRMNEVMKTLTILSVVFIPLTFLAGIYGMNFKNMPELETQWGYFVVIGLMLVIALSTLYYFKQKKWFE